MAITVPVPGLGDVIVLTTVGEQVQSGCTFPGGNTGTKFFDIAPGQLYIAGCNNFPLGGGTVAFIADAEDLDVSELITSILGLAVVMVQGGSVNIFIGVE